MKTAIIVNNNISSASRDKSPVWRFIPDSALANDKKAFFIPDFSGNFVAHAGYAVKINKLGKGIPEKFAYRYYCQYAPVIHFFSPELVNDLRSRNLPDDMAISFDKSLYIGKFIDIERMHETETGIIVTADGSEKCRFLLEQYTRFNINRTIAEISRDNTLKTGDIIIPFMTPLDNINLKPNKPQNIHIYSFNDNEKESLTLSIPIR